MAKFFPLLLIALNISPLWGQSSQSIQNFIQLIEARDYVELQNQISTLHIDPDIHDKMSLDGYPFKVDSTLLIYAANKGDLHAAKILLESGANPNLSISNLGSPIVFAAQRGNKDVVELLLEYGSHIDFDSNGYGPSAIFQTIRNLDFELFDYLIKKGASPLTGRTANYENSLTWMLRTNYPFQDQAHKLEVFKMVDILVDYGLSLDDNKAYSNALFFFVVENPDAEMVNLLLSKGASPYCEYSHIVTSNQKAGFEIMDYVRKNMLFEIEDVLLRYRQD